MDNKDYINNSRDYYNKDYSNNSSKDWKFKILSGFIALIIILSIIIIEDEFSGRNRIKGFFTLMQSKIETFIKGEKSVKDHKTDQKETKIAVDSDNVNNSANEKNKISDEDREKYAHLYSLSEEELIEILIDDEHQNKILTKIALDKDYGKLLTELIKNNSSLLKAEANSDNPLIYAAEKNSRKCVDVLINHGADLKVELDDGGTLLHIAAQNSNIPLAKQVLVAGIPFDKKTKFGKTPLYYAIKKNDFEMAYFLTNCGAEYRDYQLRSSTRDKKMLKFLEKGAKYLDVDTEPSPDEKEWREAYEYIKDGKLSDLYNLVKNGKDLLKMSYKGEPAPCIAAKYGQYEILRYLLHEFDCKNLVDYKMGRNALHYAVQQSNEKIIDMLIENGFDVNSTDLYNNTPLHYAVNNPYPYNIQILLHHGADPDLYNLKRQTPLHYAAMKGNDFAVILFIKEGAKINFQDYLGNTLLHYVALGSSDKKVLDVLYEKEDEMNLNIKNNKGETPRDVGWDCYKYYEEHYK